MKNHIKNTRKITFSFFAFFALLILSPKRIVGQNASIENKNAGITGTACAGFGFNALVNNASGVGNTAGGSRTLYTNTSGSDNTALGKEAQYANNVDYNSAAGAHALMYNTTGQGNTGIGIDVFASQTRRLFNGLRIIL